MKRNKQIIVRIVIYLVVLTAMIAVSLVIVGKVWSQNTVEDTAEEPESSIPEQNEESTEEPAQSLPPEVEEVIVYPAPDYNFVTDEITVEIEGLEREYTIAFVNDIHMITDHSSGDVTEDNMATVDERYETFFITEEGIHSEDLWPEVIKYLNYNDFDAVIFGGDILDYCSNSNIKALQDGFSELKYPDDRIMYLRSDHDYGGWYGGSGFTDTDGFILQSFVLDADDMEKIIEFDEFMIVGINQSYRNLSQHARELIDHNLDSGKPVLVATHVPFYSDVDNSLEELSFAVRNRIYYWSYNGTTYVPQGEIQGLIDRIYAENSNVVQIVAAHMHAAWDGYVTDRLKEHIFAPSFQGNIGIIHVKRSEENEEEVHAE